MSRIRAILACAVAGVLLAGCAAKEMRLADATTKAVYDNNYNGVTENFTSDLQKEVTRGQVGSLSDVMHAKGDYKGLTETGTEPDGAYDFRADFSNGSFIVKMKLNSDGKIAGYRVIPSTS